MGAGGSLGYLAGARWDEVHGAGVDGSCAPCVRVCVRMGRHHALLLPPPTGAWSRAAPQMRPEARDVVMGASGWLGYLAGGGGLVSVLWHIEGP